MNQKTVLISGASIAGPTLAFWLHRFGFNVTIVERADSLRPGGQNIDVKDAAEKIVQWMGIEEDIIRANTGELGVRFVDSTNRVRAELPKRKDGFGTSELEILRGDLAKILYNHTKDDIEYLFGDQIIVLNEVENKVVVIFKHADPRDFDLVIAADGIRSSTRKLMFGDEPIIKSVRLYNAYLTIPRVETDTKWACWYNALGSKVIVTRPDNEGTTRASFSFLSKGTGYERLSMNEQKELLKEMFSEAGWQAPRILAELDKNTDIYFDGISQVKSPRWSNGRCAMVGDAAYCPTPLTGMGASLSIIGAYVLAGELSKNEDHAAAFAAYERLLRPYVENIQKLPPGVPRIAHPKTKFGIALFNGILRFAFSKPVKRISKLFSKHNPKTDDKIILPRYQ